jgi:NADH dehydrogenase [ubiquinone] 1 alpha subcomplex assembly factor 1
MERELFRFDAPDAIAGWSAVDDRVMGGCSHSALRQAGAGFASFSGQVSLAQGGGFASVRSAPQDLGAPGAGAYSLDVRGDGKRYKLALRTDDALDGISWQASFVAPAGAFAMIRLPVSAFVATFRGRAFASAPPLDPARVRQVGLVIADGQAGPFELELRVIRAE